MVAIDDHGHAGRRRGKGLRARRAVAALFGVGLAAYGAAKIDPLPWNEVAAAFVASSWPVAEAYVTRAALDEIVVPGQGGLVTERQLSVSYEFERDGQLVTATTASPNDRGPVDDRRLLALFRKAEFARITGHPVAVSYDPEEPTRAYIEAGIPWGRLLPDLAWGTLAFLMAGSFFARALAREDEAEEF